MPTSGCGYLVEVAHLVPHVAVGVSEVGLGHGAGLVQLEDGVLGAQVQRELRGGLQALVGVAVGDEVGPVVGQVLGQLQLVGGGLVVQGHSVVEHVEHEGQLGAVAHPAHAELVVGAPAVEGDHVREAVDVGGQGLHAQGVLVGLGHVAQGAVEEQVRGQHVERLAAVSGALDHVEGVLVDELGVGVLAEDAHDGGVIGLLGQRLGEQLVHEQLALVAHGAAHHRHLGDFAVLQGGQGLAGDFSAGLHEGTPGQEVDEEVIEVEGGGLVLSLQHLVHGLGAHAGHVVVRAAQVGGHGIGVLGGGVAGVEGQGQGVGLHDALGEQALALGGRQVRAHAHATSTLASDGDVSGVAAE
eukprot:Colp12_sorted_trinity150504_noHs@16532